MRTIRIEKITLNIGAGKEQKVLEKGLKLIKHITGKPGVTTITQKRIPSWGVRPGLPIGCKLTLRNAPALEILKRLLAANGNKLKSKQFDSEGNFSFGIKEYIDIPGIDYNPEIGVVGFEVSVTLQRPGFRIKRRRQLQRRIPKKHRITREEGIAFVQQTFHTEVTP